MTNNPYTPNVVQGIQALDDLATKLPNLIPTDWRDHIDTNTLDMHDGAYCILGQIGAEQLTWGEIKRFADMSLELENNAQLPTHWEVDWGFDIDYERCMYASRDAYMQLTQAWVDYLNEN